MKRRFAIIVALLVWTAACLAFFYWYCQLLDIGFSANSIVIVSLAAAWTFSIAYFFPNIVIRSALGVCIVAALVWTLVNFAYFKIFGTFISVFSSRLLSLNLPVLKFTIGYAYTIPLAAYLASFGLLAIFIFACWATRLPCSNSLSELFSSERRSPRSWRVRYKKTSISLGLITQVGAFMLMGNIVRATATDQTNEIVARPPRPALSSFSSSRSNIETLRESLATLSKNANAASNPVRPVPPKTPHVIFYQMESADAWPLSQDPSPMPFLTSLMDKYGTVNDYFANGCTTVDAEFAINCGFLPETYGPISDLYSKNSYNCLPNILKDKEYGTYMYHANSSSFWSRDSLAPDWGYDRLAFEPTIPFREPDGKIFDRVINDIKASTQPTLQYVIGMTGHAPHDTHFQNVYNKSFGLNIQPYSGELNASSKAMDVDEKTLRLYLGFLKATDDGLAHLFDRLASEDLLDSTIVVIYGDHRYYQAKSGDAQKDYLLYNRIPVVIALPNAKKDAWPQIASHIDIAPTIFDYLTQGTETLPSTFLGTSLFSPDHKNAALNKCLGRVSYFDGTARTGGADLASIAAESDLLLARNSLGKTTPLDQTTAKSTSDINTDTDNDGLSDLREKALGTDRKNPDTDGDGFKDGDEVMNGFDPLGPGKKLLESIAP